MSLILATVKYFQLIAFERYLLCAKMKHVLQTKRAQHNFQCSRFTSFVQGASLFKSAAFFPSKISPFPGKAIWKDV